jgi:cytochrome c biogenesis protein CcmG/thiol:disulfide interchange protein DsbE
MARGRRALWIAVAVAVPVALLVAVLATRPPAATVAAKSPLVGKAAPQIDATTIDGQQVRLSDYRGKWVLVNYFATWCVPCRQEHDDLIRFQEAHDRAGDATVLAVVYDDSTQAVREFRQEKGGTWPMLTDPSGRIAIDYGVAGVPESFLVDPRGVVVAKIISSVRFEDLERLIAGPPGPGR